MKSIGLRIKSGYAIAIVVNGDSDSWRIEQRTEVLLAIDVGKYGRFPFHPLIELKGKQATETSRRAVAAVRSTAKKNMAVFLKSVGTVDRATIVVGTLIDPKEISNPHIRVHAREGELFRTVVAEALMRNGIRYQFLRDRDVYKQVSQKLARTETQLRKEIDRAGRGVVKPWRADEKVATAGALS